MQKILNNYISVTLLQHKLGQFNLSAAIGSVRRPQSLLCMEILI